MAPLKQIFLQVDDNPDGRDYEGTTWCADRISETDVRYVLAEHVREALDAAYAAIETAVLHEDGLDGAEAKKVLRQIKEAR